MDPTPTTEPFREGERAFREGRSRNDHGYDVLSWQADEFASGFRWAEVEHALGDRCSCLSCEMGR